MHLFPIWLSHYIHFFPAVLWPLKPPDPLDFIEHVSTTVQHFKNVYIVFIVFRTAVQIQNSFPHKDIKVDPNPEFVS